MTPGIWRNGSREVRGYWEYHWAADRFYIELTSRDKITNELRRFTVTGDHPEWGNWKLVREKQECRP